MLRFASLLHASHAAVPASGRACADTERWILPDVDVRERRADRARWRADLGSRLASIPSALFGPCESGVAVLTYHRLAPTAYGRRASYNVTPARFEEQLTGLLDAGYRPLSLFSILAAARSNDPDLRRSFVVTFDDGYENFYTHALPILRRLRVPATLFPTTAYLDSEAPFPFDADFAEVESSVDAELWRPLKSDQLREIVADPLIEVGSHTHSHQDFRQRPDDFERDVLASIDILTNRFGVRSPMPFSFPYGVASLGFTSGELTRRTRSMPLTCALSTEPRLAIPGQDPFVWGRFDVKQFDTAATLRGKIDGWFTWLKRSVGLGPESAANA